MSSTASKNLKKSSKRARSELHKYQQKIVEHLTDYQEMILVLGIGGGKTASALTVISDLLEQGHIRRALVFAPLKVAQKTWPREPSEWEHLSHLEDEIALCLGTPAQRLAALSSGKKIVVINYENLVWLFGDRGRKAKGKWVRKPKRGAIEDFPELYDYVMFDEISKLRNPSGVWSKRVRQIAKKFDTIHGMTASISPKNLHNLYVPATIVSRERAFGSSYDKWKKTHFYPEDYNGFNWVPHVGAREAILKEFNKWAVTVNSSELPRQDTPMVLRRYFDLPKLAMKIYRRMLREAWAECGENATILAANYAVATAKAWQVCCGFMYDDDKVAHQIHGEVFDTLGSAMDEVGEEPRLVFYWFQDTQARLREKFPEMVFLGQQDKGEVEAWNRGEIRDFALHPASAGHGLNIQFGGHHALWAEIPRGDAELWAQANGRIARQGQTQQPVIMPILAEGTLVDSGLDVLEGRITFEDHVKATIQQI